MNKKVKNSLIGLGSVAVATAVLVGGFFSIYPMKPDVEIKSCQNAENGKLAGFVRRGGRCGHRFYDEPVRRIFGIARAGHAVGNQAGHHYGVFAVGFVGSRRFSLHRSQKTPESNGETARSRFGNRLTNKKALIFLRAFIFNRPLSGNLPAGGFWELL